MTAYSTSLIYILYGLEALLAVVLFGVMLYFERRRFSRVGKAGSWSRLRIALLPIAAVTTAAVLLPAWALGGLEALALFYIGMFTVGPLTWFGLHWLIGRWLSPRFSAGEALFLGFTPIAFIWLCAIAGHMGQSLIWTMATSRQASEFQDAVLAPAPHSLAYAHRYDTPDGAFSSAFWQTGTPLKVERIDLIIDGHTLQMGLASSEVCREPGGFRWLRPVDAPPSSLRVYWRDQGDKLSYSEYTPPATFTPAEFAVQWTDDPNSFTLPEAFPRFSVQTGTVLPERGMQYNNSELQFFKPGDDFNMNCMPAGWRSRDRIDGVELLIQRPHLPPLRIRAFRPESAGMMQAD